MTTKTVGRPTKEIKRVMMKVPINFKTSVMYVAERSGMKATDYLEEVVRYMKLKPLKQMEHDYAAELYEAQMANDALDDIREKNKMLGSE